MKNITLLVVAALMATASTSFAQTPTPTPTPAPAPATEKVTPAPAMEKVTPIVAPASKADQALIDLSRSSWEGYKSKNVAAIKAMTADGYHSNAVSGPSNLQQDLDNMSKLEITSFTIDEPKVTWAGNDVGILRYKADVKGTYEGTAFKPVYASEVWIKRGGKWRILSYTETPVI